MNKLEDEAGQGPRSDPQPSKSPSAVGPPGFREATTGAPVLVEAPIRQGPGAGSQEEHDGTVALDPAAPPLSDGEPSQQRPTGEAMQLARRMGLLLLDQRGDAFVILTGAGNPHLYRLRSKQFEGELRRLLRKRGLRLTKAQLQDLMDELCSEAEVAGLRAHVSRRVARHPGGDIFIALHDEGNTQVRIGPGRVAVVTAGSDVYFHRSPTASAMAVPAEQGDAKLLRQYLNFDAVGFTLLLGWLTYMLAHPKEPATNFVILLLIGGQGTGKSHASKVVMRLVDPNSVGVQRLPTNQRDLAIAAQGAHLLAYDNLRSLTPWLSDTLCMMATGGSIATRQLYTDDEQVVFDIHAGLLLNGIHAFVEQPDLAQRCLPLRLRPMRENTRRPEVQLLQEFERDLPVIQRGLFDLIAKILAVLPEVQTTSPQRMIEFVRWLAALERVDGAPVGTYQDAYTDVLNEGQLDSLMENIVGAAVLDLVERFGEEDREWAGTPAELLSHLNSLMFADVRRPPRDWPDNEIALSKRLVALQAALMTQGIEVTLTRGKTRQITVRKQGAAQ